MRSRRSTKLPPLDATAVVSGILDALVSASGSEVPEKLYGGGFATSQIVELLQR